MWRLRGTMANFRAPVFFSIIFAIAAVFAGCIDTSSFEGPASDSSGLSGSWRVYSEKLFYDIGGASPLGIASSRNLEIKAGGTWSFGDSRGTWSASEIEESDWENWGVPAYGPTRKIILNGWNNGVANGPIEETGERVDFVWVIYRVEPPLVENAGQVQIKFGH